jgi:hypothetical protein
MLRALGLLGALALGGCSILIDSSELTGGGPVDGGSDAGTDAGDEECVSTADCGEGEICHPVLEVCVAAACETFDDPSACEDGDCCDCDGDDVTADRPGCTPTGLGWDCDDDDDEIYPGAPPNCATPAPDHCNEKRARNLATLLQTESGSSEAGLIPVHEAWHATGEVVTIDGAPQISIARATFAYDGDSYEGVVALLDREPGPPETAAFVAPYDAASGFGPAIPIRELGVEYGDVRAFAVAPAAAGSGMLPFAGLFDGQLSMFTPNAMGWVGVASGPAPGAAWPIDVDNPPGMAAAAIWREDGLLRRLDATGRATVSAMDGAVRGDDGLFVKGAGGLTAASGAAQEDIHLWSTMGELTATVGRSVEGLGDLTQVPPGRTVASEWLLALPTGTGVTRLNIQCRTTDRSLGSCLQNEIFSPMGTRPERPVGIAVVNWMPPAVALATVKDDAGSDVLVVEWLQPSGMVNGDYTPLPLMSAADTGFGSMHITGLDMEAVTGAGGDVDVVIAVAAAETGDPISELYVTGIRYCAP